MERNWVEGLKYSFRFYIYYAMRCSLLFMAFLFVLSPARADDSISIQTLNAYLPFYAENQIQRKSSILEFIERDNSDINFFQEVLSKRYCQNMENLSQSIGLSSISYDALVKHKRQSGLVTIVRGNVHEKEIHFFSSGNNFYGDSFYDMAYDALSINKGFGAAYITHPKFPDTPFWIVNIHLHHFSQEIRLLQLIHFLKWFLNKDFSQDPVIFAGDFNFEPNSLEFKIVQHIFGFQEPQSYLGLDYKCTLCPENNFSIGYSLSSLLFMDYGKTVDYIFFKSSPYVKLIPKKIDVFPTKYKGDFLSDHYGLKAEIAFNRNSESQRLTGDNLEGRIRRFSETLDETQSRLDIHFFSEHQFLNSLRRQLQKPDSALMRHLR